MEGGRGAEPAPPAQRRACPTDKGRQRAGQDGKREAKHSRGRETGREEGGAEPAPPAQRVCPTGLPDGPAQRAKGGRGQDNRERGKRSTAEGGRHGGRKGGGASPLCPTSLPDGPARRACPTGKGRQRTGQDGKREAKHSRGRETWREEGGRSQPPLPNGPARRACPTGKMRQRGKGQQGKGWGEEGEGEKKEGEMKDGEVRQGKEKQGNERDGEEREGDQKEAERDRGRVKERRREGRREE